MEQSARHSYPHRMGLITVVGEEIPFYNLLPLIDEALILSNVFSVT